jgi:hypothetical protein
MKDDVTGQNYGQTRYDSWRIRLVDRAAKILGLLIHVDGLPFGREQPPEAGVTCASESSSTHSAQ